MFSAPRPFLLYALLLEALLCYWVVGVGLGSDAGFGRWGRLILIAVLALAYEEGGKRVAQLQVRMGSDLQYDMTSVWAVAAGVGLTAGMPVLLVVALGGYIWLRQDRKVGKPVFRTAFNTAQVALSALVTGLVFHAASEAAVSLPWTLSTSVPIVLALVAFGLTNRLFVTLALLSLGARGKDLVGSLHDNLVEFATLCLGGLVAVAVMYEPWLAILAIAPMVTLQRGALVRELETAASTDAKTGLYNAITWERIAQRELARAERTQGSTGIIIVDLDRFKLVNDRFGHLAGDKVLRGIGNRLRAEVREYDTVGRFGGEEFVAVLPTASDVDALVVAERLRSRIHDLRISDLVDGVEPDKDGRLSVSIGVACSPTDGSELTDLLHCADAALYRAKALGRNRVVLADRGAGSGRDRVTAG